MFKKLFLISLVSVIFIAGAINTAKAQTIIPPATGQSSCSTNNPGYTATDCGDYTVNDFLILALNISKWVLGLVGSLTLLMFVYGGFMFLISAGSSDKVGQATKIITAAVVGLIIVFCSWIIINFVFKTMGINWQGEAAIPKQASNNINLADTIARHD